MGREEFAELVQSSIQDCQVRTSNPCCRLSRGLQACWLEPASTSVIAMPTYHVCWTADVQLHAFALNDAWLVPGEKG